MFLSYLNVFIVKWNKISFCGFIIYKYEIKGIFFNEIRWNGYWLVSVLEYINIICIFIYLFCFFVVFDNLNKDDIKFKECGWIRCNFYLVVGFCCLN